MCFVSRIRSITTAAGPGLDSGGRGSVARMAEMVEAISHRGAGRERRREIECGVAQAAEGHGADHTAAQEAGDDQEAQPQPAPVHGQTPQRMAEKDPEVGEHAGKMCGADDRAAVGADHGVLQAAGTGGRIHSEIAVVFEQQDGGPEQQRLQEQSRAVAASELEGAILDDKPAQDRAPDERGDDGGEMEHRRPVARRERRSEQGRRAGQMRDGLTLETEQSHDVDDARVESQRPRPAPDPAGQFRNHGRQTPSGKKGCLCRWLIPPST